MKTLNMALAGAIVALSVPTVMTSTAAAYQCSNASIQIRVKTPKKWRSRRAAPKAWTHKVKEQHGLAWSVWNIAKQKSVSCKKIGNGWTCTARAKPCKYVVQ